MYPPGIHKTLVMFNKQQLGFIHFVCLLGEQRPFQVAKMAPISIRSPKEVHMGKPYCGINT